MQRSALVANPVDAAEQELPEVTSSLDLTEDGLDDMLAQPVAAAVTTLSDPVLSAGCLARPVTT